MLVNKICVTSQMQCENFGSALQIHISTQTWVSTSNFLIITNLRVLSIVCVSNGRNTILSAIGCLIGRLMCKDLRNALPIIPRYLQLNERSEHYSSFIVPFLFHSLLKNYLLLVLLAYSVRTQRCLDYVLQVSAIEPWISLVLMKGYHYSSVSADKGFCATIQFLFKYFR